MSEKTVKYFTIRVYAIILNDKKEILLAEEYHFDQFICKFPGGGLELGEGTVACLEREAVEELSQGIKVKEHFYTTDIFQDIPTRPGYQLVSIYYKADLLEEARFPVNKVSFQNTKPENGAVTFRWHPLSELTPELFTFPLDQKVANMILKEIESNEL